MSFPRGLLHVLEPLCLTYPYQQARGASRLTTLHCEPLWTRKCPFSSIQSMALCVQATQGPHPLAMAGQVPSILCPEMQASSTFWPITAMVPVIVGNSQSTAFIWGMPRDVIEAKYTAQYINRLEYQNMVRYIWSEKSFSE